MRINQPQNSKCVSFHQGYKYRYGAWDPNTRDGLVPATRPPYYGMVLVAKALGKEGNVSIRPLDLKEGLYSAYAVYANGALKRIVIINFEEVASGAIHRPDDRSYTFRLAKPLREATVERLEGPGSDASKNITFGGTTFAYEVSRGKPVKVLSNKANDEVPIKQIKQGLLEIGVPASSAVPISLSY